MCSPKYAFTLSEAIKEKKVSPDEVTEIRLWMSCADLPEVSDEMIVAFIVACVRDIELTKKTIINYFMLKRKSPEVFDDCDIDRDDLRVASNTM